eukprot:scaffold5921_cov189-Ochromonas_danica.AAC.1
MKSPSSSSSSCLACSCSSSSSWYEWLYNQLQSYYLFVRLEEWQEDLRQWHESEWLGCVSGVDGKSVSDEVFQPVSRVWRSFYRQLAVASGREVEVGRGVGRGIDYKSEKSRAMLLNILRAGKLLHEVCWCVFWLVVVMVCVGGSVYGSLTVFYGSYDHEYAWTLSAAYLSGVGASGVLVAYFVCLLCVSGGLCLLRGVRSMLSYRSGRLDEASGEVEITSEAVLRGRDGKSVSVEEGVKRGSLMRVGERCCLQCDGAGADAFTHNEMGGGREDNASTAKDEQKQQDEEKESTKEVWKRSKVDWRAVLTMKVCIAVVNIFIVLVVNGFYVYIYLQLQRWSAMMLSVALSVFKVCWSMVVQVGVVKLLQPLQHHEEEEGEERSVEEGGRGESMITRTKGMRREGLHEENVRFMSSLMLFNTIVAPCLATMVASSDCFYYVFASPDTITASYSFQECAEFAGVGCLVYQTATHSIDFSPPFSYTYQCSSAMLVDYAYVFAYKYVLIGILYPLFVLGVVLYVDWCRSKENYLTQLGWLRVLERCLCSEGVESVSESGLGKEEVESEARQGVCGGGKVGEVKEVDNKVLEEKEEGEESVVEEASVSVREERQEGKMKVDDDDDGGEEEKACEEVEKSVLGEGVLVGDEGVRRGKWESQGKSMEKEKEKGMKKLLLLELGGECGRMGSSLMRAGQPLLLLVPLFYAGYVFDPAGDEGGWLWGLYLVLSLLGVLLLMVLFGGGVWWFYCVQGKKMTVGDSKKEGMFLRWFRWRREVSINQNVELAAC